MNWKDVKALKTIGFITQIEQIWNVVLPPTFIEVVKQLNAGVPEPNAFDTDLSKGKSFAELLDFNLDDKENIIQEYNLISEVLPERVYPFAANPGGNYICFDYTDAFAEPKIIFWNHEQRFEIEDNELVNPDVANESDLHIIEKVAKNFDEFLKKLYNYTFSFDDDDIENAVIL